MSLTSSAVLPPTTASNPESIAGTIQPVADGSRRESAAKARLRFELFSVDDLPNEARIPYLIDGMLPTGALAEIHGPPGGGKSFVALTMALAVATGRPFLGAVATRGPVLYVAAERFQGVRRRIEAWCSREEVTDRSNFMLMRDPVQLVERSDVNAFIAAVQRLPAMPVLIVLDTLSRCLVGADENGQREMSKAMDSLDRIRRATGATILLVHHTRKAGDIERGSTVLRGAADIMMAVKPGEEHIVLHADKVNDFMPFRDIKVRLESEGSSCVLVRVASPEGSTPSGSGGPALSDRERRALMVLLEHPDGIPIAEWGRLAEVPSSTLGRMCKDDLAPAGFIRRDGDGQPYRLTGAGRAMLA